MKNGLVAFIFFIFICLLFQPVLSVEIKKSNENSLIDDCKECGFLNEIMCKIVEKILENLDYYHGILPYPTYQKLVDFFIMFYAFYCY